MLGGVKVPCNSRENIFEVSLVDSMMSLVCEKSLRVDDGRGREIVQHVRVRLALAQQK